MWEQLKAGLVLLFFLLLFFVVGVMVGLKLPENEAWQRWRGTYQAQQKKLQPVDVAVIQFPGGNCANGVCKVAPPAAENTPAPEKEPRLTFYKELSDHPETAPKPAPAPAPAEAVKKPVKKVRKVAKKTPVTPEKAAAAVPASGSWEVRICSLPQEIKARLERSRLLKKYPGIEIEPVKVAGKGTWYRVKISNIKNRDLAERYRRDLAATGKYKPIIIKHN